MEFRGNSNQSFCVEHRGGFFKEMACLSSHGGQVVFYQNEMQ